MKTETKSKLINFIKKNGQARASELSAYSGFSLQIIHRHLKELTAAGILSKVGSPPKTLYVLRSSDKSDGAFLSEPTDEQAAFLETRFAYATPDGFLEEGLAGFRAWVTKTQQTKQWLTLIAEFIKVRTEADRFFKGHPYLLATQKFSETFPVNFLEEVAYQDFYSIPKFGKTKLGSLVLHAKQAQDKKMIAQLAELCGPVIKSIIRDFRIEAVAWVPHSIPRKVSFLNELSKCLKLSLPVIQLIKLYPGQIPIAQKTLSKLNERVENAQSTIYLKNVQHRCKRVLVIDDAVGSGATLNAVAEKLKRQSKVKQVIGFAIVGSYKGFEVIREV